MPDLSGQKILAPSDTKPTQGAGLIYETLGNRDTIIGRLTGNYYDAHFIPTVSQNNQRYYNQGYINAAGNFMASLGAYTAAGVIETLGTVTSLPFTPLALSEDISLKDIFEKNPFNMLGAGLRETTKELAPLFQTDEFLASSFFQQLTSPGQLLTSNVETLGFLTSAFASAGGAAASRIGSRIAPYLIRAGQATEAGKLVQAANLAKKANSVDFLVANTALISHEAYSEAVEASNKLYNDYIKNIAYGIPGFENKTEADAISASERAFANVLGTNMILGAVSNTIFLRLLSPLFKNTPLLTRANPFALDAAEKGFVSPRVRSLVGSYLLDKGNAKARFINELVFQSAVEGLEEHIQYSIQKVNSVDQLSSSFLDSIINSTTDALQFDFSDPDRVKATGLGVLLGGAGTVISEAVGAGPYSEAKRLRNQQEELMKNLNTHYTNFLTYDVYKKTDDVEGRLYEENGKFFNEVGTNKKEISLEEYSRLKQELNPDQKGKYIIPGTLALDANGDPQYDPIKIAKITKDLVAAEELSDLITAELAKPVPDLAKLRMYRDELFIQLATQASTAGVMDILEDKLDGLANDKSFLAQFGINPENAASEIQYLKQLAKQVESLVLTAQNTFIPTKFGTQDIVDFNGRKNMYVRLGSRLFSLQQAKEEISRQLSESQKTNDRQGVLRAEEALKFIDAEINSITDKINKLADPLKGLEAYRELKKESIDKGPSTIAISSDLTVDEYNAFEKRKANILRMRTAAQKATATVLSETVEEADIKDLDFDEVVELTQELIRHKAPITEQKATELNERLSLAISELNTKKDTELNTSDPADIDYALVDELDNQINELNSLIDSIKSLVNLKEQKPADYEVAVAEELTNSLTVTLRNGELDEEFSDVERLELEEVQLKKLAEILNQKGSKYAGTVKKIEKSLEKAQQLKEKAKLNAVNKRLYGFKTTNLLNAISVGNIEEDTQKGIETLFKLSQDTGVVSAIHSAAVSIRKTLPDTLKKASPELIFRTQLFDLKNRYASLRKHIDKYLNDNDLLSLIEKTKGDPAISMAIEAYLTLQASSIFKAISTQDIDLFLSKLETAFEDKIPDEAQLRTILELAAFLKAPVEANSFKRTAVLNAPGGAGKTTVVLPALIAASGLGAADVLTVSTTKESAELLSEHITTPYGGITHTELIDILKNNKLPAQVQLIIVDEAGGLTMEDVAAIQDLLPSKVKIIYAFDASQLTIGSSSFTPFTFPVQEVQVQPTGTTLEKSLKAGFLYGIQDATVVTPLVSSYRSALYELTALQTQIREERIPAKFETAHEGVLYGTKALENLDIHDEVSEALAKSPATTKAIIVGSEAKKAKYTDLKQKGVTVLTIQESRGLSFDEVWVDIKTDDDATYSISNAPSPNFFKALYTAVSRAKRYVGLKHFDGTNVESSDLGAKHKALSSVTVRTKKEVTEYFTQLRDNVGKGSSSNQSTPSSTPPPTSSDTPSLSTPPPAPNSPSAATTPEPTTVSAPQQLEEKPKLNTSIVEQVTDTSKVQTEPVEEQQARIEPEKPETTPVVIEAEDNISRLLKQKTVGIGVGKGRGTPMGDEKDAKMREISQGAIVELASDKPSSSKTSLTVLGKARPGQSVVMLARNGALKNTPLKKETLELIDEVAAHKDFRMFVVGDMPGVDTQFIEYLESKGYPYVVFHAETGIRVDLNKIREKVQSESQPLPKISLRHVESTMYDEGVEPPYRKPIKIIPVVRPDRKDKVTYFVVAELEPGVYQKVAALDKKTELAKLSMLIGVDIYKIPATEVTPAFGKFTDTKNFFSVKDSTSVIATPYLFSTDSSDAIFDYDYSDLTDVTDISVVAAYMYKVVLAFTGNPVIAEMVRNNPDKHLIIKVFSSEAQIQTEFGHLPSYKRPKVGLPYLVTKDLPLKPIFVNTAAKKIPDMDRRLEPLLHYGKALKMFEDELKAVGVDLASITDFNQFTIQVAAGKITAKISEKAQQAAKKLVSLVHGEVPNSYSGPAQKVLNVLALAQNHIMLESGKFLQLRTFEDISKDGKQITTATSVKLLGGTKKLHPKAKARILTKLQESGSTMDEPYKTGLEQATNDDPSVLTLTADDAVNLYSYASKTNTSFGIRFPVNPTKGFEQLSLIAVSVTPATAILEQNPDAPLPKKKSTSPEEVEKEVLNIIYKFSSEGLDKILSEINKSINSAKLQIFTSYVNSDIKTYVAKELSKLNSTATKATLPFKFSLSIEQISNELADVVSKEDIEKYLWKAITGSDTIPKNDSELTSILRLRNIAYSSVLELLASIEAKFNLPASSKESIFSSITNISKAIADSKKPKPTEVISVLDTAAPTFAQLATILAQAIERDASYEEVLQLIEDINRKYGKEVFLLLNQKLTEENLDEFIRAATNNNIIARAMLAEQSLGDEFLTEEEAYEYLISTTTPSFIRPFTEALNWLFKRKGNQALIRYVSFLDKLWLEGKEAWGLYVNGTISIKKAQNGKVSSRVLRHEAFHRIFNEYLTDLERDSLLRAAREQYGNLTDIQLEERLAEDFSDYVPNNSLLDKIKAFFLWLRRLLNLTVNGIAGIEEFFKLVDLGVYSIRKKPVDASRAMLYYMDSFPNIEAYEEAKQIIMATFNSYYDSAISIYSFEESVENAFNSITEALVEGELEASDEEVLAALKKILTDSEIKAAFIERFFGKSAKQYVTKIAKRKKLFSEPADKAEKLEEEVLETSADNVDSEENTNEVNIKQEVVDSELFDPITVVGGKIQQRLSTISYDTNKGVRWTKANAAIEVLKGLIHNIEADSLESWLDQVYFKLSRVKINSERKNMRQAVIHYMLNVVQSVRNAANSIKPIFFRKDIYSPYYYVIASKDGSDVRNITRSQALENPERFLVLEMSPLETMDEFARRIVANTSYSYEDVRKAYKFFEDLNFLTSLHLTISSLRKAKPFAAYVFYKFGKFKLRYKALYTSSQRKVYESRVISGYNDKAAIPESILKVKLNSQLAEKQLAAKEFLQTVFGITIDPINLTNVDVLNSFIDQVQKSVKYLAEHKFAGIPATEAIRMEGSLVNAIVELVHNSSIVLESNSYVRADGKKSYTFQLRSYQTGMLGRIEDSTNPSVKNGKIVNPTSYWAKRNIFADPTFPSKIHGYVDHDSIKLSTSSTVTTGLRKEEDKHFDIRNYAAGFIESLYVSRGQYYIQYLANPAARRTINGVKVTLLSLSDATKAIERIIDNQRNRPDLPHIEQYAKNKGKFSLPGELDGKAIEDYKDYTTAELARLVIEELIKKANNFYSSNIENEGIVDGEQEAAIVKQLKLDSPAELFQLFAINFFVNQYFLNEWLAGDIAFYKSKEDLTKRIQIITANGLLPLVDDIDGMPTTFRVLVAEEPISRLEYMPGLQERFVGEKIKKADGQGYILPEFYEAIAKASTVEYEADVTLKPVHYELTPEGIPVALKYSVVVLTDELCEKFPNLASIREAMREHNVQQLVFPSSVKMGVPAAKVKLKGDTIDPTTITEDAVITLRSTNFKLQLNPADDVDATVANPSQGTATLNTNGLNPDRASRLFHINAARYRIGLRSLNRKLRLSKNGIVTKETFRILKDLITNQSQNVPGNYDLVKIIAASDSSSYLVSPAISERIFAAFSRTIARSTVEQRFQGSKLVLQSDFGTSLVTTEDGRVISRKLKFKDEENFTEVIMPQEYAQYFSKNEKVIIGFRIPSTNTHSFIALKIVDFYPAPANASANVVIAPSELVFAHGSDYDIDSLFVIRKELVEEDFLLTDIIGEYIENAPPVLFKAGTNVGYTSSDKIIRVNDKPITDYLEEVITLLDAQAREYIQQLNSGNLSFSASREVKKALKGLERTLSHLESLTSSILKNQAIDTFGEVLTDPKNAKDLLLPITFDIVSNSRLDLLKSKGLDKPEEEMTDEEKTMAKNIKESISVIEYLYLVSKNLPPDTLVPLEELEKHAYPQGHLNEYEVQRRIQKDVNAGARQVGISANTLVSMAYLVEAERPTRVRDIRTGEIIENPSNDIIFDSSYEVLEREPVLLKDAYKITLDGHVYDRLGIFANDTYMGSRVNIFETLDSIINLAIDNVKESKLFILGIDNKNANAFLAAVLLGIPLRHVALLFKALKAVEKLKVPETEVVKDWSITVDELERVLFFPYAAEKDAKLLIRLKHIKTVLDELGQQLFAYSQLLQMLRTMPNFIWKQDNVLKLLFSVLDVNLATEASGKIVDKTARIKAALEQSGLSGKELENATSLFTQIAYKTLDLSDGTVSFVPAETSVLKTNNLTYLPHFRESLRILNLLNQFTNQIMPIKSPVLQSLADSIIAELSLYVPSFLQSRTSVDARKLILQSIISSLEIPELNFKIDPYSTFVTTNGTYLTGAAAEAAMLAQELALFIQENTEQYEVLSMLEVSINESGIFSIGLTADKMGKTEEDIVELRRSFQVLAHDRPDIAHKLFKYAVIGKGLYYSSTSLSSLFPAEYHVRLNEALKQKLDTEFFVGANNPAKAFEAVSRLREALVYQLALSFQNILPKISGKPVKTTVKKDNFSGVTPEGFYYDLAVTQNPEEAPTIGVLYDDSVYLKIGSDTATKTNYYIKIGSKNTQLALDFVPDYFFIDRNASTDDFFHTLRIPGDTAGVSRIIVNGTTLVNDRLVLTSQLKEGAKIILIKPSTGIITHGVLATVKKVTLNPSTKTDFIHELIIEKDRVDFRLPQRVLLDSGAVSVINSEIRHLGKSKLFISRDSDIISLTDYASAVASFESIPSSIQLEFDPQFLKNVPEDIALRLAVFIRNRYGVRLEVLNKVPTPFRLKSALINPANVQVSQISPYELKTLVINEFETEDITPGDVVFIGFSEGKKYYGLVTEVNANIYQVIPFSEDTVPFLPTGKTITKDDIVKAIQKITNC